VPFGLIAIPDVKARSARRRDRLGYVGRIAAGEMEEGASLAKLALLVQ
jgi:hypothetical protein